MSEDTATVLSLEDVKTFRGVCEDYVSNLQKGLNHLMQSTEWVHQGKDGWDDLDYTRIKTRVEGIVSGMKAIQSKIKTDLLPYVDGKIRILNQKPGC